MTKQTQCPTCKGTGEYTAANGSALICPRCKGSGKVSAETPKRSAIGYLGLFGGVLFVTALLGLGIGHLESRFKAKPTPSTPVTGEVETKVAQEEEPEVTLWFEEEGRVSVAPVQPVQRPLQIGGRTPTVDEFLAQAEQVSLLTRVGDSYRFNRDCAVYTAYKDYCTHLDPHVSALRFKFETIGEGPQAKIKTLQVIVEGEQKDSIIGNKEQFLNRENQWKLKKTAQETVKFLTKNLHTSNYEERLPKAVNSLAARRQTADATGTTGTGVSVPTAALTPVDWEQEKVSVFYSTNGTRGILNFVFEAKAY